MRTRMKHRHQYDLDSEEQAQLATATYNLEPSLTQQHFTDEVNLNTMVKRMGLTDGSIPAAAFDPKLFGPITDFGEGHNLKDVLDASRAAGELFGQLPADIRRRFNNDPGYLLDFVLNPANAEESLRLGLLQKDTSGAQEAPVLKDTP